MKNAIKEKLMNLVGLSPNDSVIFAKTNNTKSIDLFKYVNKEDLYDFVNNKISILELDANKNVDLFEQKLKNSGSFEEFTLILNENNVTLSDHKTHLLRKDFHKNKSKTIQLAIEQLLSFKKRFITLNRLAKNYFEDTTVWPLYLAFNFIRGRVLSASVFKSPLTLFKVEIREEKNRVFIAKLQDEPVVNEKLQIFLKNAYKDYKLSASELVSTYNINTIVENIQEISGYDVQIPVDEFVPFDNESEADVLSSVTGFNILPCALLGVFEPDGGALKEDLQKLIDQEIDPFEKDDDARNKSTEYYQNEVIKKNTVYEIDHPLNIYQKYAVASSLAQNTLIYGPPGTGKSEVIANIIFNTLLKGKTSLLVSEKRAALDVLTDRIGPLSIFALYIYDLTNKEVFFNKIDNLNDLLGPQWFREDNRRGKVKEFPSVVFTQEESMFFKNYQDYNSELLDLVKKHWTIEDYNDGIYNIDYADYVAIKNELGEEIINEWLGPRNFDDFGIKKQNLFEAITDIFNDYTMLDISDLFQAYFTFTKFIKRHKLLDIYSQGEIIKHLQTISNKIKTNQELVTKFLMHANVITKEIQAFQDFSSDTTVLEDPNHKNFLNKTTREKKIFIDKIADYLSFRRDVIARDYTLSNKNSQQIKEVVNLCKEFFTNHKKILGMNANSNYTYHEFLISQNEKIADFMNVFKKHNNEEDRKIIFAEFVNNARVINSADPGEESSLTLKEVKSRAKEIDAVIGLFDDFLINQDFLAKPRIAEIIQYEEFVDYDLDYLAKLDSLSNIYTPLMQEIIKEWSWLSLPYLKKLYLEPIVIFDLEKVAPIMSQVTTFINHNQFRKLKTIVLWDGIKSNISIFSETKGLLLQDILTQIRKEALRSASFIGEIVFKQYINNLRTYLSKLPKETKQQITNALRIASSRSWPSISRYIKEYYSVLKILFPIWVARPDNVAALIPLNENEFDYGIFDEASQMTIERSYPIVYRCNIKVVSGDDKQLKPTSFFVNKLAYSDFEIDDFDRVDSLLERAKTAWWNEFHLRNHYRSDSKELIEFSNKYIYDNKLEIATKQGAFEKGIEVINVNGIWDKGNPIEAYKVVEVLEQNYEKYKRILIVTFNAVQALMVENLILDKMNSFPQALNDKIENNEIVISNLENVQGNEGDLVILSIAYGHNKEGVLRNNFGPLNMKGGANRLNVAITRARKKMIVVKSLYGNEIQVSNMNNVNALTFKRFIEFIDNISTSKSINESLEDVNNQLYFEFKSDLVKEIYSELTKKLSNKYLVFPNWNIGTKKIDIVILHKDTKEILKTIILENWKDNRSVQIMLEDIDRQFFLEDRGYSTYRIKEYEWYIDKHKIISRIKESLSPNNNPEKIDYVLWQRQNDNVNK
ncbi:DUF4011 domain-containing protein [Ureaplasma miroungigenitalium]|uniref:DUF4011 domain-containing protein n=1 Tax=Ureaplasma miroungigenitalium TaxID=1042321 RepID=A0ABT3BN26_9BACT|nr:AAA domain-containing protein [Ureaplasma miroungigenitalium]MCV3728626.1 DUF4011 domain-containing protein [Ureaplasma miroungigenitalium]MCV3734318.1 DUF4011 domain-containing protein [Ureaplasma miroungigenitalium]